MRPETQPLTEIQAVQNSALGAFCIWKFGMSYQTEKPESFPFLSSFLILPLIFHAPTLEILTGTQKRSGLAVFAGKFSDYQEDLIAIHNRTKLLRGLTLDSIAVGEKTGLLSVEYFEATIRANTITNKKPFLNERVKLISSGAEKLGIWFSKVSITQIATLLKVDF